LGTQSSNPSLLSVGVPPFDLLRVPIIGSFLRWRHSRTVLQIPLLVVAVVMILHGLLGPALAPKNLATVLSWVHFRGALVLVLLCAGNFFCLACPFMLVRNVARRVFRPRFNWPQALRNKWISVAFFVAILFTYELFDLWSSPWWTAWLIIAYFLTVLVVEQNAHIALQLAQTAFVLEVGRVALAGPSVELQQHESIRRSYLGY